MLGFSVHAIVPCAGGDQRALKPEQSCRYGVRLRALVNEQVQCDAARSVVLKQKTL